MRHANVIRCALGVVLFAGSLAWADAKEDAAKVFADGKALLVKGDFAGAQEAFKKAAKADPENAKYRAQYSIVRQVIQLRDAVDKESNPEKWQKTVGSLRTYYYQNQIWSEALSLDQKTYDKMKTPKAAADLAGTHLAMGKNADAVKLLSEIPEKDATPEILITLGIAQAREKKLDDAKATGAKIKLTDKASPALIYDMACLKALLGDTGAACDLLTQSFTQTPPSRLEGMKSHAKEDKDLASLASTDAFAKALKTESKVKESSCSGGSDCSKCPSKGGCGSGGSAEKCETEKK